MDEEWSVLRDFSHYAVSNHGRVINLKKDSIIRPARNQQEILRVCLYKDGMQHQRSLPLLVARAFIPENRDWFDSPIHLDGDKNNCRKDNLAWRPRWFAVRYHCQFRTSNFYAKLNSFELIQTGEMFNTYRIPCVKYGLLFAHVMASLAREQLVFPFGYRFSFKGE